MQSSSGVPARRQHDVAGAATAAQPHERHNADEDDDRILAARLGMQLTDENGALRRRLKEVQAALVEEREAREDTEEQLASLLRQHAASVQRQLQEAAQHDVIVRCFQEKESADASVIAALTCQAAALEARAVAAAQAAYHNQNHSSQQQQRPHWAGLRRSLCVSLLPVTGCVKGLHLSRASFSFRRIYI